MSNFDLVPFDNADSHAFGAYVNKNVTTWDAALNAVFGGKPRPPRTHAVTVAEAREFDKHPAGVIIAAQDALCRRFTTEDWLAVGKHMQTMIYTPDQMAAALNARFNLISAPETDDEKWARLRREGLSEDEAQKLLDEPYHSIGRIDGDAIVLMRAFRKVLGISEAGV